MVPAAWLHTLFFVPLFIPMFLSQNTEIESLALKNAEFKAKYEREDIETVFHDLDFGTSFQQADDNSSNSSPLTNFEARKRHYKMVYDARHPKDRTLYHEIELLLSEKSLLDLYLLSLGGFQPIEARYEHTTDTNLVVNMHYQLEQKGWVIPPLSADYIYYQAQLMLDNAMKDLF